MNHISPAGLLLALTLLPLAAHADSPVFEIGSFNSSTAEFEQERDDYNTPQYYTAPGDYTAVQGNSGMGIAYAGPGAEALQDGPDALIDPGDPASLHNWTLTTDGFPRAVTSGRPVVDIFFNLTAQHAASNALMFETVLFGLGGSSSHDLTFSLNGIPFYRKLRITGDTPVKVYIPKNLPGLVLQPGGNVLSIRRTGGSTDNPWIQFDALRLTAQVAAPIELLWQIGQFDNSQAELETEWNDQTDPQFYAAAGDYTGLQGTAGPGGNFPGTQPEVWRDPGSPTDTLNGFPRAVNPFRPSIDIYFQLTAAQAQKDFLKLHTILIAQGANSTHNIRAYLNGTPVGEQQSISGDTQLEVIIPRRGVAGAGLGAEFRTGANVLSFVRTAGGPIDPLGANEPYIQFDAVSLSTAETPAAGTPVRVFQSLFSAGYFDNGANEFEQESGSFNNPQFYASAGDFTTVEGKAGYGDLWEDEAGEIWQDKPTPDQPEGSNPWANSLNGFPRALNKEEWGRPVIDIFFQAQPNPLTQAYFFTSKLFGLGGGSVHDIEFFVNGHSFHTAAGVTADTYLVLPIPPQAVLAGPNVLSIQRTGGLNNDTAWIHLDQVELVAMATPAIAPPDSSGFAISSINRNDAGHITLTWPSQTGQTFTIMASSSMETSGWVPVVEELTGTAGTTTYTDTFIPANTTRRFYRVHRLP